MATKQQEKDQKDERPETGYKDVSKAVEQAQRDAEQPLETDDDGQPKLKSSPAANEVAQEQAYRAGAQANGGGPWPEEVLRRRFIGANPLDTRLPEYTSHEVD